MGKRYLNVDWGNCKQGPCSCTDMHPCLAIDEDGWQVDPDHVEDFNGLGYMHEESYGGICSHISLRHSPHGSCIQQACWHHCVYAFTMHKCECEYLV
jgi:hypothetical protein